MDRAICCDAWKRSFPGASVRHLSHTYSDHYPILLDINGVGGDKLGERPFMFIVSWLLREKFFEWMEKEWAWFGDLNCSLKFLIEKLLAWNRDTFGKVFRRKKLVQRRLDGGVQSHGQGDNSGAFEIGEEAEKRMG